MESAEIALILSQHAAWLKEGAWQRADLYGADLRGADLCDANLYGANLRGADLRYADLYGANLRGADLCDANLYGANLRGANLYGANLRGADLRYADLRSADLRGVDLRGADLRYADLRSAHGETFATFYGGRHHGTATPTHISIGCEYHTHTEWRKDYAFIGAKNGYSQAEIERYRQWIFSLDWLVASTEGETP